MATPVKRRSSVWNHFEIKQDDDTKATCSYCNVHVSRGSKATSSKEYTTSNMWVHLRRYHKKELDQEIATSSNTDGGPATKKQPTLENILEKHAMYEINDPKAKAIIQTIAEQICLDMEPFDLVNNQGFQRTIKHLCPKYKMVSRPHISENVIPDMYCRVKEKIKDLLQELPHIVVTTDLWTSDSASTVNDFISLTAHGLNGSFEHKSYCLDVFPFEGENHTGENVAYNLRHLFEEWGINHQVRAVVADNARNMGLAVALVGVQRISCMAHSLQLVVNNALTKEIKINDIIIKARSIIGHFSHSTASRKILNNMQKNYNIPCHVLIQDVSTRWDSTLHAFRRLQEQRVAVQASLPHVKCKAELSTEEWVLLQKVVSTLVYFEEATKSISEESACLADAIPLINSLNKLLKQMENQQMEEENIEFSSFLERLIAGLNEKFSYLEAEDSYILATTLDPRYKLRTFALQSAVTKAKQKLNSLISTERRPEVQIVPVQPQRNQETLTGRVSFFCGIIQSISIS